MALSAVCLTAPEVIYQQVCNTGPDFTDEGSGNALPLDTCLRQDTYVTYTAPGATFVANDCAQSGGGTTFPLGGECNNGMKFAYKSDITIK
jgi:hypothetical protein